MIYAYNIDINLKVVI